MAVGIKTGGRQKGTPNKVTAEIRREIAASGETPLEYMLRVMRDETSNPLRRDNMAKAAAPYLHPRLSTTEAKVEAQIVNPTAIPCPETFEDYLKYVELTQRLPHCDTCGVKLDPSG